MKVQLKKATIAGINIKETITLTVKIDEIASDDLAELCKLINSDISLAVFNNQTQLPDGEEKHK